MSQDELTSFLGLEYYLLIWNRTFEISIGASAISGAFVAGVIASNSPSIAAARTSNDATLLVDPLRLAQARAEEPGSPNYLELHRFNFVIPQPMVSGVRLDPRRKWGMGPVPHSGRLRVDLRDGGSREFVLLGQLDGEALVSATRRFGYAGAVP